MIKESPKESSIFKSKTNREFPNLILKQKELINFAEENVAKLQQAKERREKKKSDLLVKVKQETTSFISSLIQHSPRFKDDYKKQFTILGRSKCPILGINSVLQKEAESLGPGSYNIMDEHSRNVNLA